MTPHLKKYFASRQKRVDEALRRHLLPARATPPKVHEAMRYSVFAGGKRLRPVLCLAAAELCGGRTAAALPTACALELIHTYSLVHDDLPAMDDDDFRRGMPTSHKKFGEAVAILAGDALLTRAFELMAASAARPQASLQAIRTVADAAGSLGMIGGQIVDLEMEGVTARLRPGLLNGTRSSANGAVAKLHYIHRSKTAALIRASLRAGALLAGGSKAQLAALDRYGAAIGLAFQIADDVLDIVGDKKKLGKRGSDRDNKKLTYPAVYGLDASRRMARAEIGKAKAALKIFGKRAQALSDLADFIIEREN